MLIELKLEESTIFNEAEPKTDILKYMTVWRTKTN
jgi:hypothetical protein